MLPALIGSTLVGLAILIATSIYRNNTSGLKGIPNAHFSAPYSRLWLISLKWRHLENRARIDFHRRLGPVVRIGPREVSVNCIENGIRTTGKFDKDESFYRAFMDTIVFMFTMLGNYEHRNRKRMLSHVYSKSHVLNSPALGGVLSNVSNRLKEELSDWAKSGTAIDVIEKNKCYAVDVASGWLFGIKYGTNTLQDPSLQNDLSEIIGETFHNFFLRVNFYWLAQCIDKLKIDIWTDSSASNRWSTWTEKVNLNAYRSHAHKQRSDATVYDYLWDSFESANPNVSYHDAASILAAECDDHLVAAHQGLGIMLTYVMYELSRHQDVQRAVREELLTLTEPSEEQPAKRIEKLVLLDAVITETLRVWTPGPGPFPRIVPATGCRLADSFDIPGGTVVSTSAWTVHFNPIPFPCPEQWRPQRWLEADEETLAEMRRWFWAFGSGPRACIGAHLTRRVVKDFMATIYTNYETSLDEQFVGNMEQQDDFMAWPIATELKLKFRRFP